MATFAHFVGVRRSCRALQFILTATEAAIADHVKLTAPRTTRSAEDYTTQRIYVTCGVWHGIYVTCGVSERRYAQNNSRKIDFLEKFAYRSRLPTGWLDTGYLPLMSS